MCLHFFSALVLLEKTDDSSVIQKYTHIFWGKRCSSVNVWHFLSIRFWTLYSGKPALDSVQCCAIKQVWPWEGQNELQFFHKTGTYGKTFSPQGKWNISLGFCFAHLWGVIECNEILELCSDWTCSGCVQVTAEEFSLLSLPCCAVENHTHSAQFCASFGLIRMGKQEKRWETKNVNQANLQNKSGESG